MVQGPTQPLIYPLNVQSGSGTHSASYSVGTTIISFMYSGWEVKFATPKCDEVKNEWSRLIPPPHTHTHTHSRGGQRKTCLFTFSADFDVADRLMIARQIGERKVEEQQGDISAIFRFQGCL